MDNTLLGLSNRRPGRIRPELGPLRATLHRLGDPQFRFPSILIVGTNGKGSTAAMLEGILRAHGLRTGLNTSPHLVAVEERIRIDGRDIERVVLEGHLDRLSAESELTFFETITTAAFLAFAAAGIEVAILEAGMGGSWDATRAAVSEIAGITNVGSDHAQWLGDTAEERAGDKGAPLRSASWAVKGPGFDSALAGALAAPHAFEAGKLVGLEVVDTGVVRLSWGECVVEATPPLPGVHQIANLHLAMALARCAESAGIIDRLEPGAVLDGLARVRWSGRLSECRVNGRRILLDGAHNLEGAVVLADELRQREIKPGLLFSCLDDKPAEAMAQVLAPVVGHVVVCSLDDERAAPIDRLAAAFDGADRATGIRAGLAMLDDPVVAAGSLRLVGRLLELADPGGVPCATE
jgi:dihydrofolate synthase/folylpolyglutamate synthase